MTRAMLPRQFKLYEVEVTAEVYGAGDVVLAATRNLSHGGVCLDTERALEEGVTISVALFLTLDGIEDADEEALTATAKVVWSSERDAGGFSAGLHFEG